MRLGKGNRSCFGQTRVYNPGTWLDKWNNLLYGQISGITLCTVKISSMIPVHSQASGISVVHGQREVI